LHLRRFFSGYSMSGFPQQRVNEQSSAHTDAAVNTLRGQMDTDTFQRFTPGQDMLVDAVHRGAIEIEQNAVIVTFP